MTNRVIDVYLKNHAIYRSGESLWVIIPNTNEWVVSVWESSGYMFFNEKFWSTFLMFYPVNDMIDNIRNWVVYKLGVPLNEHCYPDYMEGEYDWRDDFDDSVIDGVIRNGELVT
jgi:hypothetical protein